MGFNSGFKGLKALNLIAINYSLQDVFVKCHHLCTLSCDIKFPQEILGSFLVEEVFIAFIFDRMHLIYENSLL